MSVQDAFLEEIYSLYQEQPADTVWIDVRQPEEWAEGVIPGSRKIMLADLPESLPELDRSQRYIVICRSGNRSGRAAEQMYAQGFDKLINFQGGMLDWYAAGYPVE